MRHLRMVGLSLVAVFAIAAITASSASALPEWGKCEAKAGGKYSDSNCTTKAKPKGSGSFEWRKGKELANVKFSGESVGSGGVLYTEIRQCEVGEPGRVSKSQCEEKGKEVVGGGELAVECEKETNTGEAEGTNKIANVNVTFQGCAVFGAIPCHGAGLPEGEIKTNALKGKLGYISKPAKEVGVLLEPVKKHGSFAEFYCLEDELKTTVGVGNSKEGAVYSPEKTGGYDGIISPVTPVNTMTSEYTQVYTINHSTLENIPSKFEGKHIELLEDVIDYVNEPGKGTMWQRAGEEITNVNTPEEEGEIKA